MEGGAVFVRFATVEDLRAYWQANHHRFHFAACGVEPQADALPRWLRHGEWVFAPTKWALIRAVTRWEAIGIACTWYDWAGTKPGEWAAYFRNASSCRADMLAEGTWTDEYEQDFQTRTPETYRGWWRLTNLPRGLVEHTWFDEYSKEIWDPSVPLTVVVRALQEETFDAWAYGDGDLQLMTESHVGQWIDVEQEIAEVKSRSNTEAETAVPMRGEALTRDRAGRECGPP